MSRYELEHDSSDGTWWVRGGEGATIACTTEAGAARVLAALDRVDALEAASRGVCVLDRVVGLDGQQGRAALERLRVLVVAGPERGGEP